MDQAIGRSRGGLSTKIHALVDALGNPIGFFLTGGEAYDLVGADHLLPAMEADTLIADKAFDADARVLEPLASAGKTAVIPPRTNRSSPRDYDGGLYAVRHLIENFFAKIKQFRAIATRYEKTARNFLAAVQLVASVVWLGRNTPQRQKFHPGRVGRQDGGQLNSRECRVLGYFLAARDMRS